MLLLWSFCFLLRSLWIGSKAEKHVHGTVPETVPKSGEARPRIRSGTVPTHENRGKNPWNPCWELCRELCWELCRELCWELCWNPCWNLCWNLCWNPCWNLCENKGQKQTNVPTYQEIYCCMYCISRAGVVQPLFLSYVWILKNMPHESEASCRSIWNFWGIEIHSKGTTKQGVPSIKYMFGGDLT